MSDSARRYSNLLHTPDVKNHMRVSSKDRFLTRSVQSTNPGDFLSADKSARYSISYLPGASEHAIDTGKTLAEAQMKVVVFACEVERLSSQNYELVKENEVLRTQTIKSERERDLETKLAIVLAENEKLNRIIEDVYETYMAERGGKANEMYEKRIAEVLQELEQWKHRYSTLQGTQGGHDIEGLMRTLEEENKKLNETLMEKERDMDMMRARLEAKGVAGEVNVLEEKILWLVEENARMKDEMKAGRMSGEQERLVREYREKMMQLLAENDNLRKLWEDKMQEEEEGKINELPAKEINMSRSSISESAKMTGAAERHGDSMKEREDVMKKDMDIRRLSEKLGELLAENEKLNVIIENQMEHIEKLEKQHGKASELFSKTEQVTSQNEQLNNLLREKLDEIEKLRKQMSELKSSNGNFEELNKKIRSLLERNDELNNLVLQKVQEVEMLKAKIVSMEENDGITDELKQKLLVVTAENARLNKLLIEKIDEVEKIRRQLLEHTPVTVRRDARDGDATEDLRRRVRELENEANSAHELRNRLQLVTLENEKLNSLIGHQLNEGEEIRKKLSEIDHTTLRIQELTRSVEILRGENERMNRLVMEKQAEIEQLRMTRNESAMLGEVQTKLMLVTQENLRLDEMLVEKLAELEKLKRQMSESGSRVPINTERLVEENEKLSAVVLEKVREIEALKTKLNALEFNDRVIAELKIRLQTVMEENDRLNNKIMMGDSRDNNPMTHQTEEMSQYAIKINQLTRALEEKTHENQSLVREIAELQNSFAALNEVRAKVALVSAENERLVACMNEKSQECNMLRARIGELEGNPAKVTDLEEKIVLLCSENQRLLGEIERLKKEDKTQEFEAKLSELLKEQNTTAVLMGTLKQEMMNMTNEHAQVVNTLNVDIERHQEELKKAGAHHHRTAEEVESRDRRITELEEGLEIMKRTIGELEEKLALKNAEKEMLGKSIENLEEENKKMNVNMNQALVESEDVKQRFIELEAIRAQELDDFRDQFETLKDINREIKELQVKTAAERMAYETQIAQYRITIGDLERQRDMLISENERLTALSLQRLEECEKLKRNMIEMEEAYKLEISELKSKVEQYKADAHDVKKLALKYGVDKAADQSQINQLKELNENYKHEIKKLYELLEERKNDLEEVQHHNQELRQSQSQLMARFTSKQETETGESVSLESLKMQFEHLEKAKDEYKHQAERNSVELSRRNGELVDKIQQLDVLKLKYEEAFANYQALSTKLFERLSVEK